MEKWMSAEKNARENLNQFFKVHFCMEEQGYSFVQFYIRRKGYMIKTRNNPVSQMTREEFLSSVAEKKREPGSGEQEPVTYWRKPQIDKKVPLAISYLGFLRTDQKNVFDFSQKKDYYLTSNGYTDSRKRHLSKLSTVHNMVIDVDCHSGIRFCKADMEFLGGWLHHFLTEESQKDPFFFEPNTIVNTGRGFQIWWSLKGFSYKKLAYMWETIFTYYLEKVQNLFSRIKELAKAIYDNYCEILGFNKHDTLLSFSQNQIRKIKDLECFSVDAASSKKRSGLFRVPGTFNSTINSFGSFRIYHSRPISAVELFFCMHPETGNPYETYKKKPRKSRWQGFAKKREEDLQRLISHRQSRGISSYGYRDIVCLLVCGAYCSSGESDDATISAVKRMNRIFDVPMAEKELVSYMSTCMHKKYKFGNEYMIEALGITEEEQVLLGIGDRKKTDASRKKMEKEERIKEILRLEELGFTQTEIAKKTECSQSTVCRVLKKAAQEDGCSSCEKQELINETGYKKETKDAGQAASSCVTDGQKNYSNLPYIIYSYSGIAFHMLNLSSIMTGSVASFGCRLSGKQTESPSVTLPKQSNADCLILSRPDLFHDRNRVPPPLLPKRNRVPLLPFPAPGFVPHLGRIPPATG